MNWSTVGVKAVFRSGCGDSARIQWARLRSKRWTTERGLHVGDPTAKLKQLYPGAKFTVGAFWLYTGLRRLRAGRRPDRHRADEGRRGRLHPGRREPAQVTQRAATRRGRPTPACPRAPTASRSCPGPTFAAPYHLAGPADASRFNYGRYDNPTWARLEDALGELEGAQSVVFASGMAAVSAVVIPGAAHRRRARRARRTPIPGSAPSRATCSSPTASRSAWCPPTTTAVRAALPGATLVWLESPSNPGLDVLDLPALVAEAHAGGRRRGRRQHARGAAAPAPARARRGLLGDERLQAPRRATATSSWAPSRWPTTSAPRRCARGASPRARSRGRSRRGWRIARWRRWRCASSARRPTRARSPTPLRARDDVSDVRWPGVGSVVCFDVGSQARADAFLEACELVAAGHELRRPALQRRAPRALGQRRRRRGLHPLQRRDRGRARPRGRRRARARAQPTLKAVPQSRQAACGPGAVVRARRRR